MSDNRQRAEELLSHAYCRADECECSVADERDAVAAALDEAEARGRAEGYREALARSRTFCSGCSMPDGRHWDTCPNRWDGRPSR